MSYPEIGNVNFNFKCTFGTFKQQLALKMRAPCGISIVLLKRLCTIHFGICTLLMQNELMSEGYLVRKCLNVGNKLHHRIILMRNINK